MSSPLDAAAKGLHDRIVNAWSLMPIPPTEELMPVKDEEGEEVFDVFAGKKPLNVDRTSDFERGCPLLYMGATAAAAYVSVYLLVVIEAMLLRKAGNWVFDQLSRAHLFAMLGDSSFAKESLSAKLNEEQKHTVISFIQFCIEQRDLMGLNTHEIRNLVGTITILDE